MSTLPFFLFSFCQSFLTQKNPKKQSLVLIIFPPLPNDAQVHLGGDVGDQPGAHLAHDGNYDDLYFCPNGGDGVRVLDVALSKEAAAEARTRPILCCGHLAHEGVCQGREI